MTMKRRLYACGGFGVNLAQHFEDQFEVAYIDTSQSNRTENLDINQCYFVEGLDGSGQWRKLNYPVVSPLIPDIIERFPSGDFNLVLFSAAGGSGSVIGPLLIRDLLLRGETVVAVMAGADDAARTNQNTLDTLKSLETISANTEQPVVLSYHQNTAGVPRSRVDEHVTYILMALADLTSQENRELDTQDVTNWIQFQTVTSMEAQLAMLQVFDSRAEAKNVVEPISVASLYMDEDMDNPFGTPHYATKGYPRQALTAVEGQQLHFIINTAEVEDITNRIQERAVELARTHASQRQRRAIVDQDDNHTSDGMVFD